MLLFKIQPESAWHCKPLSVRKRPNKQCTEAAKLKFQMDNHLLRPGDCGR